MLIFQVRYIDAWTFPQCSHFISHRRALSFATEIARSYAEIREKQLIEYDRIGEFGGILIPDPRPEIVPIEFHWSRAGVCRVLDTLSAYLADEHHKKMRERLC